MPYHGHEPECTCDEDRKRSMDYMCADCFHEQDSMSRKCDKCGSFRVVLASMAKALLKCIHEQSPGDCNYCANTLRGPGDY